MGHIHCPLVAKSPHRSMCPQTAADTPIQGVSLTIARPTGIHTYREKPHRSEDLSKGAAPIALWRDEGWGGGGNVTSEVLNLGIMCMHEMDMGGGGGFWG